MANNPHVSSIASSLSSSPYAVQSNLENLINRSRSHPHPRRLSDVADQQHYQPHLHAHPQPPHTAPPHNGYSNQNHPDHVPFSGASNTGRRGSQFEPPRIGTIREASYDDGAAILLPDDDEEDDERSRLLSTKPRRESRRKSYGTATISEPIGMKTDRDRDGSARVGRRRSDNEMRRPGNSRSRSKARTPPRRDPVPGFTATESATSPAESPSDHHIEYGHEHDKDHDHDIHQELLYEDPHRTDDDTPSRGRAVEERPLSPVSTKYSESTSNVRLRRSSITTRFADDSSGDEGGDVARGLVVTGGAGMLGGGRVGGSGFTPATAHASGGGGAMDIDPVEELDAVDLELPVAEDGKEAREWTEALRIEIPLLIRSSVPVFFTQTAEYSLVLASVVSIGHLGTTELAASSLASMTASVSSFSLLIGLATSLDTLLPAAWTSSDPTRVGLWTQRTAVVMSVSMIPMFILWWNIEGILIALGQEADVAEKASTYLRYLSFGIPGYGGNVLVKKYLQAQNLMNIPTYVLFIVAPANLLLNYLLIWGPDAIRLGFVGGAVATSVSYNLNFLLLLGWALFLGPREAFHPLTFASTFSKLGTVTSLGLAGTIMVSSEWWAWEVCALAASLLGPTTLAAQSVLLSTASTFFQVPMSLGVSSAVRCGNLLGAGRGWEAKWASRASLILSVLFALINSAVLIVFRKRWGYLFNSDAEVVAIVADVLPYIALFQITDGVAATAGSVLRSLGLHTTGALINLTSYYIIGLPFGLWLAFAHQVHLGLVGLWIGLSIALGYASLVSALLVWRANWTRAVERVRERLGLAAHGEIGSDGKWEDGDGRNGERRGLLEDVDEESEEDV